MKRRDFLKATGLLTAHTLVISGVMNNFYIPSAFGDMVSVSSLRDQLNSEQAAILVQNGQSNVTINKTKLKESEAYKKYQSVFNLRYANVTPSVRVMCFSTAAVSTCILWAKNNQVPIAMRCGGHSFEGLSQSKGIVIDIRFMNQIQLAQDSKSFVTGSGANLGSIYNLLSKSKLAIPAGSCPPVGVSGHTTGGGYGLLARPLGLACDSLISAELVNADGNVLTLSENENSDLFWAIRGAGGGSFGVVTKFQFKTHKVAQATVYSMAFALNRIKASELIQAWQQWAPESPKEITSLLKVSKDLQGVFQVRCIGQSVGSESQLNSELNKLSAITKPTKRTVSTMPFIDAVQHFSGGNEEPDVYMKGKSDYVKSVMTDEGLAVFLKNLPNGVAAIFDSYGGAISNKSESDTAFAHRQGTISSVQYYTQWSKADQTEAKLKMMRDFYNSFRSHISGSAYVNYPDLDLKNYAEAYWGSNLERLSEIKSQHDPTNLFKHAQSVPLKGS